MAFFRYINPLANIRLGAGRALLTNDGETAFKAGASATITGNMLTTVACATIRSDRKMLNHMGRDIKPEYMTDAELRRLMPGKATGVICVFAKKSAACGGEKSFCGQLWFFIWVVQVCTGLHHLHQLNHFFQPFLLKNRRLENFNII